ncbi:MAG TPA: M13 family metallopeptidase [Kofleriaceae bacterium]|nr:M13 family metallopeptidase [Kofleriaceae bacterium]
MMRACSAAAVLVLAACSGNGKSPGSSTGPGAPGAGAQGAATQLAPARAPGPAEASGGAVAAPAPGTAPGSPASPAAPGTAPGSPVASAPAPAIPAAKVTLGDVGLEALSLDRTADPCVDFYQFACGGWLQNNPIPPDRAQWGRSGEVDERNKLAIKSLLDDAARGTGADPEAKKLGDFYSSCLDEAAIDRAGTTAWRPLLARTQGVKDARSWLAAVVELHKLGIFVVWDNHAAPDLKSSTSNVTYLDAGGLSLPDRDYYVKPELRDKLEGFTAHVGRMLGLLGATGPGKPEAAAADVVAIETELAKLTKTAVEQRDVPAAYNPTDLAQLGKQVKSVDWPRYFQGLGAPASKRIIVGTPRFFAGLDRLRARFAPGAWASYFTYHLIANVAHALPRAFDDEAFELKKLVSGVEKQRERTKRCIDLTSDALGELLGRAYVAKYFPGNAKQNAIRLVDAIAQAMAEDITGLDWMTEATKQVALAKVARIVRMIGYPDRWKTYELAVRRDDFAGNVLRAAAFETHRQLARAGKPVDRVEWQMNAYEVNAYYDPRINTTAFPAGILQPPFFALDRTIGVNLGGIGMGIGHELTHAFDDQGAQFDAEGNLRNWWQKDDLARFAERGKCVADQYSGFEALPRKFIQGQLTLGENIADMGGVKMAFRAYRALRKDAPKTYIADGFSEDQQFFLAVAQAWCGGERPAETERRLTADPHSPPKFRVYGALRNLPEFAEAFACAPGTPMRPARTCTVW